MLDDLAEALDRLDTDLAPDDPADPATWTGPQHLVHMSSDLGDPEVCLHPLPDHPAHTLLGFVAPEEWDAIGTLSYGWAGEPGPVPPSRQPDRRRVRLTTLVDRDGEVASRMRDSLGHIEEHAPGEGVVLECLQRAIGVSTAPPPVPTGQLFGALWLEAVAAQRAVLGRRLAWGQAAQLHPASVVIGLDGRPAVDPDHLADLAAGLNRALPWSEVRWLSVSTGWLEHVASPTVAAWMDDGMFARTALHLHPIDLAWQQAENALTARARAKVAHVLGRLAASTPAAA